MRKLRKAPVLMLILAMLCTRAFPATLNDTQIIPADHKIYGYISTLYTMSGMISPTSSFPASVGELKFLLRRVDSTSLDAAGTGLYEEAWDFLFTGSDKAGTWLYGDSSAGENRFRFDAGATVTLEAYGKTDAGIPWFYSRNTPYLKDHFLRVPVMAGFGDFAAMEMDLSYGRPLAITREPGNAGINLPLNGEFDFLNPRFAYGSTGFFYQDWGMSFHIGNDGLTIGKTSTGSIIYNSTFETQSYAELKLFSDWYTYAIDVAQVTDHSFLYLHHQSVRPFRNLRLDFIEGGYANRPMEMRYLNPFMLIHNWFPNETDYNNYQDPAALDADRLYCAYMGIMVEYVPVRNVRIYALWAQTELQAGSELDDSEKGIYIPDGYGLQVGTDISLQGKGGRVWALNGEALYALPYLYMKQSQQASLFRRRTDTHNNITDSWIGTPFGPDTFAAQMTAKCSVPGEWSVSAGYLITMNGEIDPSIFTDDAYKVNVNGTDYYAYYPLIKRRFGLISDEDCRKEARSPMLTGIIETRHDLTLSGEYSINERFTVAGQVVFTMICNKGHVRGAFGGDVEAALSVSCKLL